MKTERKSFDLGLYSYKPICHGLRAAVDEASLHSGQVVAVLHPMRKVDPEGLYCLGLTVDPRSGSVSVLRKNLKFNRVVTLSFEKPVVSDYAREMHLALDVAQLYLSQQPGVQALIETIEPQTASA